MTDIGRASRRRLPRKISSKLSKPRTQANSHFLSIAKQVLFFAIALILVAGFVLFATWRSESTGPQKVPVLEAGDPENFAAALSDGGTPVVLKNTVVQQWEALGKWTPEYLAERIGELRGVYSNDNRWFGPYYDDSKPMAKYCPRINTYKMDLVLPGYEFAKLLFKPDHGKHVYFTGDIDSLGLWAFDEVQPIGELLSLNPKHSSVNVWIGQPNVIAHCHYDGYHNFYAQLYGRKKFKLYPPTTWPGLYPYPFLHPSHAQAQVNLSHAASRRRFRGVERVWWKEAVVEPGDLLYIPPLWFHEVEAIDVSISVNVWTDPIQASTVTDMFAAAIPFEHITDRKLKTVSAAYLVHKALNGVCRKKKCSTPEEDPFFASGNKDGSDAASEAAQTDPALYLIHRLWRTRFKHIMESKLIPSSLPKGLSCRNTQFTTQDVSQAMTPTQVKSFVSAVTKHVAHLPADTWELWLGNYIEYIASLAVDVDKVGAFLKDFEHCLL